MNEAPTTLHHFSTYTDDSGVSMRLFRCIGANEVESVGQIVLLAGANVAEPKRVGEAICRVLDEHFQMGSRH